MLKFAAGIIVTGLSTLAGTPVQWQMGAAVVCIFAGCFAWAIRHCDDGRGRTGYVDFQDQEI